MRRLAIAAGLAVVMCSTAAADEVVAETPGTSYAHSGLKGWQGETRRDRSGDDRKTPDPSSPDGVMTVRVYERSGGLRPYVGDEPLVGVDVTAEIDHCPDGNERISALNIGGWRYVVDGDCPAERPVTRTDSRDEQPAGDAVRSADTEWRCDPATWRCRITGR